MEVFIKVMNGLMMILEDDKRNLMCLAALLYEQFLPIRNGGAKISIKSYFMEIIFFSAVNC